VLYTGDYRSESTRLHDGAATVKPVDMIIAEGTYGAKMQPDRVQEEERLKQKIRSTLLQGGTVVVPLLSSGRAQEVLSIFSDEAQWLREQEIPVHLRGGIESSNEIYNYLVDDDPKNFTSRVTDRNNWLTLAKLVNASRPSHSTRGSIRKDPASTQQKGRILFASGGMVQGKSEELVRQYCHDPKNLLVFTCFQVPGTLGRRILDYHQGESQMLPEIANFQMDVYYSQLSAHSSGPASVAYVSRALKPGGTVLLVHGELRALNEHADALRATGIPKHVIVPAIGERFEFPFSYARENISNL
jgi:predicted metal-dependent RNase